ncbi:hypothetical protein ACWIGM_18345 [Bosea sp. NPDC055332]
MSKVLDIGQDEILVLSELLHRWFDDKGGRTIRDVILDDSELWALNALNSALERNVPEAMDADYRALLDAARTRVRNRNGGGWPQ